MLISLAWKNIWRNKKRSLILFAAIAFGLWGGLISAAFMMGMGESVVNTTIDRDLAHIQIHNPAYVQEKLLKDNIPGGDELLAQIKTIEGVKAVSGRTLLEGMAATSSSSFGVRLVGIRPEDEVRVTVLEQKIIEGDFFKSDRKNSVIIGKKLASRLNAKLNSKIVLSFQNSEGTIIYHACRVVGIFQTESALFDETNVFLKQSDMFGVLGTPPVVHEIVVRNLSDQFTQSILQRLKIQYPNLLIRYWKETAAEIAYLTDIIVIYSYVFVVIILFALLFGITNTMLMSVVDRIRELGMLLAVGMNKGKVFLMVLFETVFLSVTGSLGGIAIGIATIAYFTQTGFDLSAFSSSLETFGMSTMLYPFLPVESYLIIAGMVVIAAVLASFFPAWKAIHIVPSKAIRDF